MRLQCTSTYTCVYSSLTLDCVSPSFLPSPKSLLSSLYFHSTYFPSPSSYSSSSTSLFRPPHPLLLFTSLLPHHPLLPLLPDLFFSLPLPLSLLSPHSQCSTSQSCCHGCGTVPPDAQLLSTIEMAYSTSNLPSVELEFGFSSGSILRFPAFELESECTQRIPDARLESVIL